MKLRVMVVLGCILILTGCSSSLDISIEELDPVIQQVNEVTYPKKTIIALGEATHGNKELTELKLLIFQNLVEQQDIRVFALEGDMGGCQKVNEYIQGGEGTAEQAVFEIGFAIYQTEEMVDLVEWMRSFNSTREASDQIRFYGYDMQRYDNSREKLLNILEKSTPELSKEYTDLLDGFTDETMYELDPNIVKSTIVEIEKLNTYINEQRDIIISRTSKLEFDLALQYAECIKQNSELRLADKDYGTIRDEFMANNVSWILQHEKEFYDNNHIFITGHNGHIGKTTATVGVKKIMGEILAEKYGDEYFAIGTEFYNSTFLASDYDTAERLEYQVQNSGDNCLSTLLHGNKIDSLYLDMGGIESGSNLEQYFNEKQPMSSIGDMFADYFSKNRGLYTQEIAPSQAYNGIVFIDTLTPSTMIETK